LSHGCECEASKNPYDGAAIGPDVIVNNPAFFVVISPLIVWLLTVALVERVADALVEDVLGILWPRRAFRPWNRVRQSKVVEELAEIDWMVFDIEPFVEEVLDFLWFPGLAVTEEFKELFLLVFAELRGTSVREVRLRVRVRLHSIDVPSDCRLIRIYRHGQLLLRVSHPGRDS
jgi:hypothetical protein